MMTRNIDDLRNADINFDCHLKGIHTYDMLRNPEYYQAFQYYAADNKDRALMIVDDDNDEGNDMGQSDLVRVSLNLAFLSKEEV